jgi:hypothetical protein
MAMTVGSNGLHRSELQSVSNYHSQHLVPYRNIPRISSKQQSANLMEQNQARTQYLNQNVQPPLITLPSQSWTGELGSITSHSPRALQGGLPLWDSDGVQYIVDASHAVQLYEKDSNQLHEQQGDQTHTSSTTEEDQTRDDESHYSGIELTEDILKWMHTIRDMLSYAQREHPSKFFRKNLNNDQVQVSEREIQETLKDLIDAYAQACWVNKTYTMTATGSQFESNLKLTNEIKEWDKKYQKLVAHSKKTDQEHFRQISQMRNSHQAEKDELSREIASLKRKTSSAEHNLKVEKKKLEDELRSQHEIVLDAKSREIGYLKNKILDHEGYEKDFQIQFENAIITEKKQQADFYEPQISKLRHDLADAEAAIHARYQEQLKQLMAQNTQLKKLSEQQLAERDRIHEHQLNSITFEMQGQEKKLKDKIQATIDKAKKEKENAVKKVTKENQTLKGALVNRDNQRDKKFKPMTDRIISEKYQVLMNDVEDIANITWDKSKRRTWPIGEQQISKSQMNERATKKLILQNKVWMILQEKVFKTPFRVLGSHEDIEGSWKSLFGASSKS